MFRFIIIHFFLSSPLQAKASGTAKDFVNIYDGAINLKGEIDKLNLQDRDGAINICDLSNIVDKFKLWKKHMPSIKPFYAIKCNDEIPVLKTLKELGTGFDCASKNEIKKVLDLGVTADRIIFANPMKSKSFIKYAQSVNVTDSTVDNEFEMYKIFKHYPESNVILRFRSDGKTVLSPVGNKFGCEPFENGAALMLLAKSLNMNMTGVSFHVGSGCSELEAYERAISTGSRLFKFGNLIGHKMQILDIGGGFPGDDEDDMFTNISKIINEALDKYFGELDVEIIAEPGRFFVHSAYTTISKVIAKREVRKDDGQLEKIMYYMNDGVFGTFACTLYEDLKIEAIHFKKKNSELFDSFIWGPTCDGCDKISESMLLPNLEEGDFLAFPNMGAYTVPIMTAFNGFDIPQTYFYLRSDYSQELEKL